MPETRAATDEPRHVADPALPGGLSLKGGDGLVSAAAEGPDKMRVRINHTVPVELFHLTACFNAVASEYARYSAKRLSPEYDDTQKDLKLYVHEIRPGSIEVDLVLQMGSPLGAGLFAIQAANAIAEFCRHVAALMNGLKTWGGSGTGAPEEGETIGHDKASLENAADIAGVVANNAPGASFNIGVVNKGTYIERATFNFADGQAIVSHARELLHTQAQPAHEAREKVLLYWDQMKNKLGKVETDKAIVDAIWPSAVKVHFANDGIKARMLAEDRNFFLYAWLVDLRVGTVRGKPVVYIIERIHDAIPLPDWPPSPPTLSTQS